MPIIITSIEQYRKNTEVLNELESTYIYSITM